MSAGFRPATFRSTSARTGKGTSAGECLLGRPENERPFLILETGYPAADAVMPDLEKRPLSEVAAFI